MPNPHDDEPFFHGLLPAAQDKVAGISDLRIFATKEATNQLPETQAIAQMIIADGVHARATDECLFVSAMPLSEVTFLGSAKLSSDPADKYDLAAFLDQLVVRGSTAVAVKGVMTEGPDKVFILTARHSVVERDIDKTYFIFDRDKKIARDDEINSFIQFPFNGTVYKAKRIFRIPTTSSPDYCLIEVDDPGNNLAERALPLATEPLSAATELFVIGHPLGLPAKHSMAGRNPNPQVTNRVFCDFASGGSGSPLIQRSSGNQLSVAGILTGQARFTKNHRALHKGRWFIRPVQGEATSDFVQPLVPAADIRTHANQP
jgi:hypothetical protein